MLSFSYIFSCIPPPPAAALQQHLWDGEAGVFTNKFFNGSFYRRYSPTSFYPLISGVATDEQVSAMVEGFLTSPQHFCVTEGHRGPANTTIGVHYVSHATNTSVFCASDDCINDIIRDGSYYYVRLEALPWAAGTSVDSDVTTAAPATVQLQQWRHTPSGGYAIATSGQGAPGNGYQFIRTEALCAAQPTGNASVPLDLWLGPQVNISSPSSLSSMIRDHLLCGTASCAATAAAQGYVANGTLCYAFNASGPDNAPCLFGVPPSISRSDAAFGDGQGEYWRGRIWAPHAQLLYWGLKNYDHVPAAQAARKVLVSEAKRLFLRDWLALRHVNENTNPLTGSGSDNTSADPAYHWGALSGFLSFQEAGLY